jgi:hypothetical protein
MKQITPEFIIEKLKEVMKQLNQIQGEWLKYRRMRELMEHFRLGIIDEDWGPNPKSDDEHTPVQFFNFLYSNNIEENNIRKMDKLELTEEFLSFFCHCTCEEGESVNDQFEQLKKQAIKWEIYKG